MPFPTPFKKIMQEAFTDKDHPAYSQVATVDKAGKPQVRTVHMRYWEEKNLFAFSTNTLSPKWKQIEKTKTVAGCYFDTFRQIQFRWESSVKLIPATTQDEDEDEKKIVNHLWGLIRAHIRVGYWLDYENVDPHQKFKAFLKLPKIFKPCPTFGVVVCQPKLWDLYEVKPDDVTNAKRTIFSLEGNKWRNQTVSLLHGQDTTA